MTTAGAGVRRYWAQRSPRERAALAAAAIVAVGALAYLYVFEPMLTARRRLAEALPVLRAQAEEMRHQGKEIASLRSRIAKMPRKGDVKALLQTSAASTRFARAIERIEAQPDDRIRVVGAKVPFDEWLAWTDSLQRDFGVRIETCRIAAGDRPGIVSLEATFVASGRRAPRQPT